MGRGACQATVHGVARVGRDLATKSPPCVCVCVCVCVFFTFISILVYHSILNMFPIFKTYYFLKDFLFCIGV